MIFRRGNIFFVEYADGTIGSEEKDGTPHFYGRHDIVEFLKSIRLDQIPWKEYHIY